jgi:hypothetical protein
MDLRPPTRVLHPSTVCTIIGIRTDMVVGFDGTPNVLGPSDYMDLHDSFLEAFQQYPQRLLRRSL